MNLLSWLRSTVYVQLHPERLTLRHVQSGRSVSGPPVAAVSTAGKQKVVAVGEAALTASAAGPVRIVYPFKHPRTILADFTAGEVVLKGFLRKLFNGQLFAQSPVLVLHPRVDPEGGFTQIEIRALQELAIAAGAAKVIVWKGRELLDPELLELRFPSSGEVLN